MNLPINEIIKGDCREILLDFPDNCIDLIVTSPPYSDARKSTYGGIHPDEYADWFLPIAKEFKRVIKPSGSFVLNIKEKALHGERHTYVLEIILGMKQQKWRWVEEYCWHKKNSTPGKWRNRFRDSWERCLHFTKHKDFKMNQESVMVPMGKWAEKRLRKLSKTDMIRDESKSRSGFGKNVSNWVGREKAYPTNVLHMATVCNNKNHSATFPEALPEWFIKLFTDPGDIVLDPFLGSGTTAIAAKRNHRKYIGIELHQDYHKLALSNVEPITPPAVQEEIRLMKVK